MFTLAQLAILFGGDRSFQKALRPFHEVRQEGVFVVPAWYDAGYRQLHAPSGVSLCPRGVGILDAVLPPKFTERELLTFLTLRGDMAWELERLYTNDKPKRRQSEEVAAACAEEGEPAPLDEEALSDLASIQPAFAELLRRRLPMGNRWNVADDEDTSALAHPMVKAAAHLVDYSALATRKQLIAAFGAFTGMDMTWFKNLKDTPALLKARKVEGVGARSKTKEPLFCPFEVMQWLTDEKRRKGRGFHSAGKPWELLERYFPLAYSKHRHNDMRDHLPG